MLDVNICLLNWTLSLSPVQDEPMAKQPMSHPDVAMWSSCVTQTIYPCNSPSNGLQHSLCCRCFNIDNTPLLSIILRIEKAFTL